ncbi:amylo-alpha-1,6-glucosidase [Anaerosporobacter faecicola]|uniref:amylo-alpha-1,6-glucosidase n=1 Tax=Anaerosporobacter faecicola TaxID=2718714 RepID=UPI00143CB364|nr:amylo-alpha-1,6-glucosidase [Anaerosporobacter faecicola]
MRELKEKYVFGRNAFRTFEEGMEKEWLLTNGIGGFANQSIIGANTRIYSGYLIASLEAPVDRMMIFPGTHEMVTVEGKEIDLTAQEYIKEWKRGYTYLNRFTLDILPTYTYQINDLCMKKTIAMEHGKNTSVVCYEITNGMKEATLAITPMFTYRDFGGTKERAELKFQKVFRNYPGSQDKKYLALIPEENREITIGFYASEGTYYDRSQKPVSMATPNYLIEENQVYPIDQRTGFLGVDNHITPYDVIVTLAPYETKRFYLKCTIEIMDDKDGFDIAEEYRDRMMQLLDQVPYQTSLTRRLAWGADAFLVDRKSTGHKTILAGYPWFADWGRDTMIALQGLTMATGRYEDARSVLESFSYYVSEGMIPNVFPNNGKEEPRYNTIDASLWYFYSVDRYLSYTGNEEDYTFIKEKIYPYLKQIITAYKEGTRYGIHMDTDYLIEGGSDFDQLTWMDVRVGDLVVTPRHGKAVEINALWYNALKVMEKLAIKFGEDSAQYCGLASLVKASFVDKFWNKEDCCLFDVIEKKDGVEIPDSKIRPNQIWAVSLPYTMLPEEKEMQVVNRVYHDLYTPYGIRSLSNHDPAYKKQYIGKLINRDLAYHMGTAWAYISGAFITAYCKVNKHSKDAVLHAKEMCEYFEDHMQDGCLSGIAEIFDGDNTCTSRGCYTQAWSVGEILRAYTEDVLPYLS